MSYCQGDLSAIVIELRYQRAGSLAIELDLIQTQMTQRPMLRAEVGMRVRCANKASPWWLREGRVIHRIPRKIFKSEVFVGVAHSAKKPRVRRASKEARDMRNTKFHWQRSKCTFQRARRLLFCPWAIRGSDGTGTPSSSAEWQWIEQPLPQNKNSNMQTGRLWPSGPFLL